MATPRIVDPTKFLLLGGIVDWTAVFRRFGGNAPTPKQIIAARKLDRFKEENGTARPDRIVQLIREGHEVDIHGIQHQLDGHEDDDEIAPHHHADDADDEQRRRQQHVMGWCDHVVSYLVILSSGRVVIVVPIVEWLNSTTMTR